MLENEEKKNTPAVGEIENSLEAHFSKRDVILRCIVPGISYQVPGVTSGEEHNICCDIVLYVHVQDYSSCRTYILISYRYVHTRYM